MQEPGMSKYGKVDNQSTFSSRALKLRGCLTVNGWLNKYWYDENANLSNVWKSVSIGGKPSFREKI
jgi:hypothetical protein